jgi:hypothetical protein
MPQVFISHSSKDRRFVEEELVPLLEHHSINTWYSRSAIRTAAVWEDEIRRGLAASDWFLVVLSPHASESDWVKAEVRWALDKRKGRLIPIMIAECDPAETHLQLAGFQYVDFRDATRARVELLSLWDRELDHDRTLKVTLDVSAGPHQENTFAVYEPGRDLAPIEHPASRPERRQLLIVGGATIGRDPTAEIYLNHYTVSRRHAELKVRFHEGLKSLWLVDLASANGVFLNDLRISAPEVVRVGGVIGIGEVRIVIGAIDG